VTNNGSTTKSLTIDYHSPFHISNGSGTFTLSPYSSIGFRPEATDANEAPGAPANPTAPDGVGYGLITFTGPAREMGGRVLVNTNTVFTSYAFTLIPFSATGATLDGD
jgi:hypothetical protein